MGLEREGDRFPAYRAFRHGGELSPEIKEEPVLARTLDTCNYKGNSPCAYEPEGMSFLGRDAERPRNVPEVDLSIGLVVPVLNEGKTLHYFLSRLSELSRRRYPVVVVDGGSADDSVRIARQFFHTETISAANRGMQLNHGARCLFTDVLLFLHADSELPRGFDFYIRQALANPEVLGGCFRLEFDARSPILQFYSWFTRLPGRFFHYGDQGFFVRRDVFWEIGGFSPLPFLEDVDFLCRLKRYGKFVVLHPSVRTSARRFMRRGVVRQQLANILLVTLFELGVSAGRLARFYQQVR